MVFKRFPVTPVRHPKIGNALKPCRFQAILMAARRRGTTQNRLILLYFTSVFDIRVFYVTPLESLENDKVYKRFRFFPEFRVRAD